MSVVSGVTIEMIPTVDQLRSLADAWDRLWWQCPWATPFQRREWLLSYCEAWEIQDVLVIAVRHDGQLVALVPMLIYCDAEQQRRLVMLGAGYSDYQDALLLLDYMESKEPRPLTFCVAVRRTNTPGALRMK